MSDKPSVYLAGPILGGSYDDSVGWREHATAQLAPEIVTYSPMRWKDHLKGESELKDASLHRDDPILSPKGIVARDRFDVRRASILLVNFLASRRVSIGTCVEFGWADAWRKPIVMVIDRDNGHDHAFLRELAGFIVEDVDAGIQVCRALLLDKQL
jgi:nucleoside 2-deoxyribosyltransferase